MNLVVDANILFSALITDGFTHTLLFTNSFQLFTPEYVFVELEAHKQSLIDTSQRTTEDFLAALAVLKRRVTIVPLEELIDYVAQAEEITPDPDDMVYFALALHLDCAIWSNDKQLKTQDIVPVYHTHELAQLLD